MAKKRTLVNRLNVDATNLSGISTRAMSSPVETYVRPAEIQSTPSPLSQFVSALAPAVEARANKELEVKLKRERRIENFNFQKEMTAVSNEALKARNSAIIDYDNNKEVYHQTDTSAIIEKLQKHTSDYVDVMKENNVDELSIENYKLLMSTNNIELISKIEAGKKDYIKGEENKGIASTIISFTEANGYKKIDPKTGTYNKETDDKSIELLNEVILTNANGYKIFDPKTGTYKPDKKRMNDIVIKLADDLSVDQPDNLVLAYLEKYKVLDTKDNIAMRSKLRNKRDSHLGKVNTAQIKATAINNKITKAVLEGNILDMSFKDGKGGIKSFTALEAQEAAKKNPAYMNLPTALKFKKMATMGIVFPEVQNQVLSGVKFLTTDQGEPTDATNAAIKESYVIYQGLKNAGNNMSFLNKADKHAAIKFKALQFHVDERGASGQDIQTVSTTLDGDGIGAPEVGIETIVKKDFNNAASLVRNMDFKVPRPLNILKTVEETLTEGWNSPLANVTNSPKIRGEIATNAHYFLMGGGDITEEKAIKLAIELAEEDNPVVTSAKGKKYSFEQLNTDMDAKISPTEVIPKYNELLAKSNIIKEAMKDKHGGLKAGEYDVALYPDENDPTKVIIKTFSLDGSYLGQLGGAWDKRTLLSDQDQLNQLMATVKTQDNDKITTSYNVLTTDTYNQLINTSLDKVLFPDVVPQADDFSNTIGMINASSTGQGAIRRAQDKEGIVVPDIVPDVLKPVVDYVLGSTSASVQNSEVIGELATKAGKFLSDPVVDLVSDGIDALRQELPNKEFIGDDLKDNVKEIATKVNKIVESNMPENFTEVKEKVVNKFNRVKSDLSGGDMNNLTGADLKEKVTNLITKQEGFRSTKYKDGKNFSIGHGLYLPSLTSEEKAIIDAALKTPEGLTEEISAKIVKMKVDRINTFFDENFAGFATNLPEKAQLAITSMAYQLGEHNLPKKFKLFTAAIKKAAGLPLGSEEQNQALASAKFEMLYNRKADGNHTKTGWHSQTPTRANEMAEAISDAKVN